MEAMKAALKKKMDKLKGNHDGDAEHDELESQDLQAGEDHEDEDSDLAPSVDHEEPDQNLHDPDMQAHDADGDAMDSTGKVTPGAVVKGARASEKSSDHMKILKSIADKGSMGRSPSSLGERAAMGAKEKIAAMLKVKNK